MNGRAVFVAVAAIDGVFRVTQTLLIQITHRHHLRIGLAEKAIGVARAHHAIADAGHGDAIVRRRPALPAQHRIGMIIGAAMAAALPARNLRRVTRCVIALDAPKKDAAIILRLLFMYTLKPCHQNFP